MSVLLSPYKCKSVSSLIIFAGNISSIMAACVAAGQVVIFVPCNCSHVRSFDLAHARYQNACYYAHQRTFHVT